jgi:hypothetical protein
MPFFLAPLRLGVRFSSINPRRMDFARDQKSHDPRRLDGNQGTQRQSESFFLAQKILSQSTHRSWVPSQFVKNNGTVFFVQLASRQSFQANIEFWIDSAYHTTADLPLQVFQKTENRLKLLIFIHL